MASNFLSSEASTVVPPGDAGLAWLALAFAKPVVEKSREEDQDEDNPGQALSDGATAVRSSRLASGKGRFNPSALTSREDGEDAHREIIFAQGHGIFSSKR